MNRDEKILNLLAEGFDPRDIAADLLDHENAALERAFGEPMTDSEKEIAFTKYEAAAERILKAAGGPDKPAPAKPAGISKRKADKAAKAVAKLTGEPQGTARERGWS